MDLRGAWLAGLARQLGHPSGIRGRMVGALLNRRNRQTVSSAVEALSLTPGAVAMDVGFGGGVGLELLLTAVAGSGQVHGAEISRTMRARAARRLRREISAGRLHLHAASIADLPLADDTVDGILTVNTVYFFADLAGAFAELARVLKPSGRVVVGLTDPAEMARAPFIAYGFGSRPVAEVIDALRGAGLALVADRRVGAGESAHHLLVSAPVTPPA